MSSATHRLRPSIVPITRASSKPRQTRCSVFARAGEATVDSESQSRSLVPKLGPTIQHRCQTTSSTPKDKTPTPEKTTDDVITFRPRIRRHFAQHRQDHRGLDSGRSRQELGTRLRSALRQDKSLDNYLGSHTRSLHRYGLNPHDDSRDVGTAKARKKIEYAAAATATLGKYRGAVFSDQYLQNDDLSNEVDGYLRDYERDGKQVPESMVEKSGALKRRKVDQIREGMKDPAPESRSVLGDFERRLYRNPYAKILSSSIRNCQLTAIRQPSDLMSSFGAKLDSKEGQLWMVPEDFQLRQWERPYTQKDDPLSLRNPLPRFKMLSPEELKEDTAKLWDEHDPLREIQMSLLDSKYALKPVKRLDSGPMTPLSKAQGINAGKARSFITPSPEIWAQGAKFQTSLKKSMPVAWRTNIGMKTLSGIKIREDMQEFIVKLTRRRVARLLAALEHTLQDIVRPCVSASLAQNASVDARNTAMPMAQVHKERHPAKSLVGGHEPAVLLWFGESWGERCPYRLDDLVPYTQDLPHQSAHEPLVPVYDMQSLLSKTEYDWLRALEYVTEYGHQKSVYRSAQVVINESIWSTYALSWLWRLQVGELW